MGSIQSAMDSATGRHRRVQRTALLRAIGLMTLAAQHWGCTDYEPASDTLPADAVNELSPPGSSREWGCLSSEEEPVVVPVFAQTVARVVLSVQIVDLSTGQIYPDARVRACGVADINCENPVTDALPVDAQGWVDVPLFRDFTGFLEITSAEAVPFLFYLTEPLTQSTVEFPLGIISIVSLGPLVQLIGVDLEPSTGVIAVRSFDCTGSPALGVTLSTDTDGVPWYFVDGLPTGMGRVTEADGLGGLVNVTPGLAVVDLLTPSGVSINGAQSVVVRPNWLSAAYVRPRTGRRLEQ
jgi:hypothetical protein